MAEKTNSAIVLVVKVFNSSILETIASARKPVGSLYALLMAEILVFYFFFSFYVLTKSKKIRRIMKRILERVFSLWFPEAKKSFYVHMYIMPF